MRASLMARLVAHPTMAFGSHRRTSRHQRLGLDGPRTTYHQRRLDDRPVSVGSLRRETSQFRFPAVGAGVGGRARRASLSLGVPRARQS